MGDGHSGRQLFRFHESRAHTSSESTIFCSWTEKTMAKRRVSLTGT